MQPRMGHRGASRTPCPENLADDLGAASLAARHGVSALCDALRGSGHSALERWATRFARAYGSPTRRSSAALERLAEDYGVAAAGLRPEAVLFALHTYDALAVKLLLAHVLAALQEKPSPVEGILGAATGGRLRRAMEDLEAGRTFERFHAVDFCRDDPFCWYTSAWSKPIEELIRRLASTVAGYRTASCLEIPRRGNDHFKRLYQGLLPAWLRHELGEYYTPDWLADHVLDRAGYSGDPAKRLLDPACGSGTFLLRAIRRVRTRWEAGGPGRGIGAKELCRRIVAGLAGFELNPLAAMTARANCLMAIGDLLPETGPVDIPVLLCDSILDGPKLSDGQRFDYVVGNPPWIVWDNLPADYRRKTTPLWKRYGLFSLSGTKGRHGGGKKDLAMLMVYVASDRYLKTAGRLAMVVTQTLFQTKGAGDGFRRFRLGSGGQPLSVLRVDDMVDVRPFHDAANRSSTILLEKGSPTRYPVPYVKWLPRDGDRRRFTQRTYRAEPIEPGRPGSPWLLWPEGRPDRPRSLIGSSDYRAHLGANSGGANGVYWLQVLGQADGGVLVRNLAEKALRGVAAVECVLEPGLLYPLVRWADVARFRAAPSAHLLLAQDVNTRTGIEPRVMQRQYPRAYAYLKRFERLLKARAAYRRYQRNKPFYSMYNVGGYTVAPIKVLWRRMDRRINAAVVEPVDDPTLGPRPAVPQETCALIAADSIAEAHYVCGVLNSLPVHLLVAAHSVHGGKGFGTPGLLDFLRLPRFQPASPLHQELALGSRRAHRAVAAGEPLAAIQHGIDRLAAELFGLGKQQWEALQEISADWLA